MKPPAPGFLFTEADLSDQAKEPSAAPGGAQSALGLVAGLVP